MSSNSIPLVSRIKKRTKKNEIAAAERMKKEIIDNRNYAHKHGIDKPEILNWKWS
jgi:phosphoketolase